MEVAAIYLENGNREVPEELMKLLNEIKPILDGTSGSYLGQYEDSCICICDFFEWSYYEDGRGSSRSSRDDTMYLEI